MGDEKIIIENEKAQTVAPQMPPEVPPPTPEEIATPEILAAIVKGYNPDCELMDFSAKLGTNVGDNYMSIMYAIALQLKNRKNGLEETLEVMLKTIPRNAIRLQMINDCAAFVKDASMYNQIFPDMLAFQKEKGLKEDEIFQGWPACYSTFHDGKSDYLAMEDLRASGYKMASRHSGLDFDHTMVALRNLAKFHAISFAMFGGDYDKIMEKYPFLEEKMFLPEEKVTEPQKLFFKSAFDNVIKLIENEEEMTESTEIMKTAFEGFWKNMEELIGKKRENAVVLHGDSWTNNLMFKYSKDGKPEGLKFIDFQLSRCSSRGIDLHYFIFSSPQYDAVLNNREEEIIRLYHEEFNSFVQKLGVNPDMNDLSWETFKADYDECRYYGVFMGFLLAPIIAAQSDQVPDMEHITEDMMTSEGGKEFLNKMTSEKGNQKIRWIAAKHLTKCTQFSKN